MLQPRFKAHTIYFPDNSHGGCPWVAELETELLNFTMQGTRGLHDDVIDALAYAEQIARVPYSRQSGPQRITPEMQQAQTEYKVF